MVGREEVFAALKKVFSLRERRNLVEAGLVEQVDISGGAVRVKLKRPRGCTCTYSFMLAVLAEKELRKLEGVEKADVQVML